MRLIADDPVFPVRQTKMVIAADLGTRPAAGRLTGAARGRAHRLHRQVVGAPERLARSHPPSCSRI